MTCQAGRPAERHAKRHAHDGRGAGCATGRRCTERAPSALRSRAVHAPSMNTNMRARPRLSPCVRRALRAIPRASVSALLQDAAPAKPPASNGACAPARVVLRMRGPSAPAARMRTQRGRRALCASARRPNSPGRPTGPWPLAFPPPRPTSPRQPAFPPPRPLAPEALLRARLRLRRGVCGARPLPWNLPNPTRGRTPGARLAGVCCERRRPAAEGPATTDEAQTADGDRGPRTDRTTEDRRMTSDGRRRATTSDGPLPTTDDRRSTEDGETTTDDERPKRWPTTDERRRPTVGERRSATSQRPTAEG